MVIGIFDSGVGGLTVLKELATLIPEAKYLYFGDTARLPYGSKSVETIAKYAISAAQFLQQRGAELMVIACNTATALAFASIQKSLLIPVIGVIEPGAEAAAQASRNKKVIVIGTEATISSHAYQRALFNRGIAACEKACPLFVPLVEEGWTDHAITEQVAHIYLDEALKNGSAEADVLVLGCTHYPLLKPLLRRITPQHITIVDSAKSTAQTVAQKLQTCAQRKSPEQDSVTHKFGLITGVSTQQEPGYSKPEASKLSFFATDSVEKFRRLGERFLGCPLGNVTHVDIEV